ncbi:MAG: DUF3108 domain-containing protein [Proteobacteria bacterium]|nr:DUF3108 domain-containing protein [Pseudomonadota bacterium]
MKIVPRSALAILFCLGVAPQALSQSAGQHSTDYTVTLAGFTIAKASFNAILRDKDYTVLGRFRSAGIADLISEISGETSADGAIAGGKLVPDDYRLVYRKGKRSKVYEVKLKNGNIINTSITPPPRRDPVTWVAMRDSDFKRVLDPLTGLMIPGDAKLCSGAIPVFDGETRMDIVLSDKGKQSFGIGRKRVDVTTCSARYVPRAGYKRGRKDIEFLKGAKMEVWFAKSDAVNVYAPVYIRVPTSVGDLKISATRFGR